MKVNMDIVEQKGQEWYDVNCDARDGADGDGDGVGAEK